MKSTIPGDDQDSDDVPWLRDMVDDEFQPLFVDDETQLKRAVRHFIRAVGDDSDVEEKLIDLLETAAAEGNDDTSASLMTAIILGEARSVRAIPVLLRCLASDADEVLQDAAQVALLRIGAPAVHAILETIDESEDGTPLGGAYGFLGQIGVLEDRELTQAAREFLRERVGPERKRPHGNRAIEELFHASALLGDTEQLEPLRQVLADDFQGKHSGLQDVIEMLEENPTGITFVATPPPWETRYGWLFDDAREQARVVRNRSGEVSISLFGDEGDLDAASSASEWSEEEPGEQGDGGEDDSARERDSEDPDPEDQDE